MTSWHRPRLTAALLLSALSLPALTAPALAQEAPAPQGGTAGGTAGTAAGKAAVRQEIEEIIITGTIAFRNRTSDPNPVLAYDLEYFQRFEPVSVGEMLKRVPGVTFTSDVLEYDAVQMRGLPAGYTQVLINGRTAPGGEADRSFFVDRIPAELVERVEIVRAPRADQPSEGVAGTLNVITKDSARFAGGFAKIGGLINDDGKIRPSAAVAYADTLRSGDTSYWVALNYQGRRNPKEKVTDFYDGDFEEFTGRELQSDTRDGVDISANGELTTTLGGGSLRLFGLVVDTDRDEDETSLTYEGDSPAALELDEVEIQRERIGQRTYALGAEATLPLGAGDLGLAAGWSGFREDTTAETDEGDTVAEAGLVERETLDTDDDEVTGTVSYRFGPEGFRTKLGVDLLHKKRDNAERTFEIDGGDVEEETPPGAIYTIKETRIDPYARLSLDLTDRVMLDLGARYEMTDREVDSDGEDGSHDSKNLNPSAHLRYNPTASDHFLLSVARTVRRPDYDLLAPYRQEEEPADDDELIGNPSLANEMAWGIDVGYERQIGRRGIFGVNVFYRDVTDVIELVNTGEEAEAGGSVYQARNIGDGETWGVEADLSLPLDFAGLPDTGVFANYTWLDSSITDPFTGEDRRFNNQPRHVYNVGFIQTLPSWDVSFGASLSGRSGAEESSLDETIDLRYGQELEAFIEKRFAERFVLRLTGTNLLNRKKKEDFRFFDGDSVAEMLEARRTGDVDEAEKEREESGALFQVTLRAAF
ncbi:TonB-dependent receptor plug domain-containing protein [Rhodospirillum centenum]|uniref:TonB-dependent receptor, putative n=1 Tax=Rhodospirillum centenum (strain ATCC 51521 / SW) TaxID=414684 RepID=B6IQK6_RHOCS|nr:TonB-dependent receptor [Rhodospirillum centenum]ACI97742.1 TonB-dependent receptor, putative [Rhodospirillum centenum SW]